MPIAEEEPTGQRGQRPFGLRAGTFQMRKKGIWERSSRFSDRNKPTCLCRSERKPEAVPRPRGQGRPPTLPRGRPHTQGLLGAVLEEGGQEERRRGGTETHPPTPFLQRGAPQAGQEERGGGGCPHLCTSVLLEVNQGDKFWSQWTGADPSD